MAKKFSSVWTRPPRPSRSAGLSRDQIVAAALELLDAEGLEALSMRKLGARLNAGATSLYWHVANKDDLLELALDEFWGWVRIPEPEHAPWREVITTFVYSLRATMLEHPWVAGLIGQMPMVGPKAFELSDRLRRAFVQAGFTGLDIYLASGMVMSFVLGQVVPEISLKRAAPGEDWDYDDAMATLEQVAPDYPEMLADYRDLMPTDPNTARMVAYDFGLLCVLDGLEARLRAAATQEPARKPR
ncbi:TetR/AcrR family transcriptional regulator C-terminal domain-containing protein [Nocardia blacklockiae]|uniref:TetR/AcrR family transcriptional regulator C-terminal domain-containing protein n=1 Tax=Nocardia blacklockiae TaxID=480036 RepID=UPI0018933179|nr:TetR/AcrR family transcriptional regulator C-terminal domain-containing protein [Nocardia blacklockiae]MBF6170864.1 TetR/AcrR family transcriptional regulator C-terminal domain-containing protein [Nocardia blacklockiae]